MAAYSLKETNYSISNFYQNTAKFPVGVEGENASTEQSDLSDPDYKQPGRQRSQPTLLISKAIFPSSHPCK